MPEIDMPIIEPKGDRKENVEVSDHNRLFPNSPSLQIRTDTGRDELGGEDMQSTFETMMKSSKENKNANTCYCPCQCTNKHTNQIIDTNGYTTEDSRTSSYTTGYAC